MNTRERKAAANELAKVTGLKASDIEELAMLGFGTVESSRRMIIASWSSAKKGKSHFALTAPGPIAVIDTDLGLEGMVDKFKSEKVIIVKSFIGELLSQMQGGKFDQDAMNREWDALIKAYQTVCRNPLIRTLVCDTATDMWELCRMAHFGTDDPKGIKGHPTMKYGPPNREFRKVVDLAKAKPGLNVILTHRTKRQYIDDKRTGKVERSGYNDMEFLVQVNIEHLKDKDGDFGIRIDSSRQNPDVDDEELWGPECEFPTLGTYIYPGTKRSDWK